MGYFFEYELPEPQGPLKGSCTPARLDEWTGLQAIFSASSVRSLQDLPQYSFEMLPGVDFVLCRLHLCHSNSPKGETKICPKKDAKPQLYTIFDDKKAVPFQPCFKW